MAGGCQAYLHLQDWPIEGKAELTGNLPEQIGDLGVLGQDRGRQRGDPARAWRGSQMRDEAAANSGALPGVLHQHACSAQPRLALGMREASATTAPRRWHAATTLVEGSAKTACR